MCVSVCLSERYRIQSDRFEDTWLVVNALVQRFDQHFSALGVHDFKKSFSGPLPLQEYFLSVDHHFQVHEFEPKSGPMSAPNPCSLTSVKYIDVGFRI